jgi:hypothetical protein
LLRRASVSRRFGCNRGPAPGNGAAIPPAHTAGVEKLRKLSPYLMVELLLPGGTLIAILLWLFNRSRARLKG